MHLYLGFAVAHRALDDLDGALNGFFVRKARWFLKPIEQRLLLGLPLGVLPRLLGCLFGFREREFLHEIACARQQLVGFSRHVPSSSASRDKTSALRVDDNLSPVQGEHYIISHPSGEGSR